MAAYRAGAVARAFKLASLGVVLSGLAACGHLSVASSDRECMARVMYFESIRSSEEGMLAVGTVVMNRVHSGKYPRTVCGVIGQPNQFASGALTSPMPPGKSRDRAYRVAGQVLAGRRHSSVGNAMFFHTAGRTYGYSNMNYVAVAGGNAFYERKPVPGRAYIPRAVIADAGPLDSISAPRWSFGSALGTIDTRPRASSELAAAASEPQPPRPTYAAAAPAPPPSEPSIEALILASNGF